MKDDYKLQGATTKLQIDIEKDVAEKLEAIEGFAKFSKSEIVNTAVKRFISQHMDFLPPRKKAG
jgi:hypothetical protein